jgi:hypothetical protein
MSRILIVLLGSAAALHAQTAIVRDLSHTSQVMNGARTYQAILPPAYATTQKRYPVIYWFTGYEQSDERRDAEINQYVATHNVIVVRSGPVETVGLFPLYFPELAAAVDKTLRTVADRNGRAVTGFSMAGFVALWIAGKYPDLVTSASSFMGNPSADVGPRNLDTDCSLDDMHANYEGVRTRLVTGRRDPLRFYHQRMNGLWLYAAAAHETEEFDAEHGTPEIAKTLDFHLRAFANPLPMPAVFSHADVYPDFSVWGWEVVSERREPGFTVLQNVTARGFRSSVREWVPGGATIPSAKLSVVSAPLFAPGSTQAVTYLRLRDSQVRRASLKADQQGRLTFDLDGDAYDVGISAESVLILDGCEVADTGWATAGGPLKLRVKFRNAGQARSATTPIQFESPNGGVKVEPASVRLYGLAPGETAALPVTVTVPDATRAAVRIVAVEGTNRIPTVVPLFPPAPAVKDFHISDGQTLEVYQHAIRPAEVKLGDGNGDGQAAPGETFAVLLPDGAAMRAGELFTNDECVDTSMRGADSWDEYDHAGVPAIYTLAAIRADCQPGHVVHALVRLLVPVTPHQVRYGAIEFPVWYRNH